MAAASSVSSASSVRPPDAVVSAAEPVAPAARKRRLDDVLGDEVTACAGDEGAARAAAPAPKAARTTDPVAYPVACPVAYPAAPVPIATAAPVPIAVVGGPIVAIVFKTEGFGAKRPQMKYDPSVPMTKEQTSAWRRERRRERNRESAAACRRRQRDRISELEDEAAQWRGRVERALGRLAERDGPGAAELRRGFVGPGPGLTEGAAEGFEGGRGAPPRTSRPGDATSATMVSPISPARGPVGSRAVSISPRVRPDFLPPLVASSGPQDLHFPILEEDPITHQDPITLQDQIISKNLAGPLGFVTSDSKMRRVEKKRQHSKEMITRPAVKITGAADDSQLETIESVCDDLLQAVPDGCLSLMERGTMPFPETSPSLVVAKEATSMPADEAVSSLMTNSSTTKTADKIPSISGTDESGEDSDLGEFLLDALPWL